VLLSRATGSVASGNVSTFDVIGNIARDDIVTIGNAESFPWQHLNFASKAPLRLTQLIVKHILYPLFIILHIKPELLRTSDWYQHILLWRATADSFPTCKEAFV